jgi:RNA polymerase sigma factor (sigma-70 family)
MAQPPDDARASGVDLSVELLHRARAGDESALELLCGIHRPLLRRWARGRLPRWARDAIDTEDLVQETLLHTVHRVDGFEPRHSGAFQVYLRRALDNRIRDEIRKVRRRPPGEEILDEHEDPSASPLEEAIGTEAMRRYESALDRLDEDDRSLIVARIEMALAFDEIARMTGRPTPDAARMAVSRALVKLAAKMDRD